MKFKTMNLLLAFVAVLLFGFSCFCISKMSQISNQLTNCRNHIMAFKHKMLRLKNKSEDNHNYLLKILKQMEFEISQRRNLSSNEVEKKEDVLSENPTTEGGFEDLKLFLPHLRKMGNIYPNVVISRGKTGVSFVLGITTVSRQNHTYLKQTLTSVLSRMTPEEEKDALVVVSVADTNEDYLHYVVDMINTRFRKHVKSGCLEVISVPTFFYPPLLLEKQEAEDSPNIERWRMKQVLDFCILMLYAQPKAEYYLQLEDDIIATRMYFTQMREFVNNVASNDWFYILFSTLGFIGKLFRTKDLTDFVKFFLVFYKEKPIDLLLLDIFLVKHCESGESFTKCMQRKKKKCLQYVPSLFQHVGIHSSFPGRVQYLKKKEDNKQEVLEYLIL